MNNPVKYSIALILCALGLTFFSGCKSNKEELAAQERVEIARELIEDGNLEAAKLQLDTVHLLYRQQVSIRREAKHLQDTVALLEAERTAAYADSMLQVLLPQVDPLLKKFRYEKDGKYEDNGQYVSKLLQTTSNTERCFLQAYVGDNRATRVKSYYVGSAELCQTEVELCVPEQEECASWQGAEHHFDADGWHSILTVEDEQAIEILAFIATHADARIRVRQFGKTTKNKQTSPAVFYLGKNEKEALVETLQLATLFHDINRLEEMQRTANRQIAHFAAK